MAGLLIFVPIFYIAVRSGRIRMRVVGAFFGLIAMALLVLYLPVSAVYEEKMRAANPVHPYLQLFPPASEAPPKEEDELRVVCLGGSTTEWPSSTGERWTELLEDRLQQRFPDKKVRVFNQGREWFTTQHSLINYETRARLLEPDVVVVMHAINDFMVNADHSYYSEGEFRDDYAHYRGALTRVARNRSLMRFGAEVFDGIWYHREREALEELGHSVVEPPRHTTRSSPSSFGGASLAGGNSCR